MAGQALHSEPTSHASDPVLENTLRARSQAGLSAALGHAWGVWQPDSPPPEIAARVLRTHYKPFHRARLVAEGSLEVPSLGRRVRQYYYLQVYAELKQARLRRAAALRKPPRPCHGPPIFLVEDWNAVAYALPNGPRLRSLAKFLDPARFRAYLIKRGLADESVIVTDTDLEILRYVPRKRVLARYAPATGACLYIKFFTKLDHFVAARRHKAVSKASRQGQVDFRTPRIISHKKKKRALVMSALPGRDLTQIYGHLDEDLFARVGAALASLHLSPLASQTVWSLDAEKAAFTRAMQDVTAILPGLSGPVEVLENDLDRRAGEVHDFTPCPIHANLFGDQILVDEEGTIGMVDWDDLSFGDPVFDVGRLIAHMIYVAGEHPAAADMLRAHIEALLRGYVARGGPPPQAPALVWHVATALLMRGKITALRRLAENWPDRLATVCRQARSILEEGLPADLAACGCGRPG